MIIKKLALLQEDKERANIALHMVCAKLSFIEHNPSECPHLFPFFIRKGYVIGELKFLDLFQT